MDLMEFLLILLVIFFISNMTWIKCIFNPLNCATDSIAGSINGVKSFFSDIGNKLSKN